MNSWLFLFCAGLFELGFTTFLRLIVTPNIDLYTKIKYNVGFAICIIASFYCLNKSIEKIPLGTAYAVWTGIGAVGTAALGIIFFSEPISLIRIVFLATIIIGIIGLKLAS